MLFAEAHAYGAPPLETSHHGGVFTTRTLPRDSGDALALKEINQKLIGGLGLVRGVTHAEFLKATPTTAFISSKSRPAFGGAYISDVIEAATGINLWREWARLEVGAGKQPYELPPSREDYAGVIVSLARQEEPDTSAYNDPEIVYRITKYHHAGFVLKSPSSAAHRTTPGLLLPTLRHRLPRHPTRPRQAHLLAGNRAKDALTTNQELKPVCGTRHLILELGR